MNKPPDKNKRLPGRKMSGSYGLITNKSFVRGIPQEKFEHWGILVYSQKVSGDILQQLSRIKPISVN